MRLLGLRLRFLCRCCLTPIPFLNFCICIGVCLLHAMLLYSACPLLDRNQCILLTMAEHFLSWACLASLREGHSLRIPLMALRIFCRWCILFSRPLHYCISRTLIHKIRIFPFSSKLFFLSFLFMF